MTNLIHSKRAKRIRSKLKKVNSERFRLTVNRSSRNISAQIIDDVNKNLTLVEKIKKFYLLNENFSIENGLLTPTMKVKRNKVIDKYKNILENFYRK